MNKRELIKGAAGAAVALSAQQDRVQARPPSTPPPINFPDRAYGAGGGPPANDPLWAAKNAFRRHANEQAELENQIINRKIRALQRCQSRSCASVDFEIDQLNKHRKGMWDRLDKLMQSI